MKYITAFLLALETLDSTSALHPESYFILFIFIYLFFWRSILNSEIANKKYKNVKYLSLNKLVEGHLFYSMKAETKHSVTSSRNMYVSTSNFLLLSCLQMTLKALVVFIWSLMNFN